MSITVIGAGKLTGELRKLNLQYRQEVLDSMSEYLDLVRILAIKQYIIPDQFPAKGRRYKQRNQKSDPTRLTSRTGAYLKMLKTGIDKWDNGPSTRKSRSFAVQGDVKTLAAGTLGESYEGKLSFDIREPYAISKVSSGQQLAMRFKWDSPSGIRGKRRPNLSAANEDLIHATALERIAKKRLQKLGVM